MKAIAAADRNWAIGKDGGLLCHIPGDLKYFKEKTKGHKVIMGRKTLESLPGGKPLPDREHIILSRTMDKRDDVTGARTVEEALSYCDEDTFVCGGAEIYRQFSDYCDTFLITRIDEEFDADTYFPCLDNEEDICLVGESDIIEEKGYRYRFLEYRRRKQND